jgi:FtsP/CotA-like multicopper oxidase with cupredoxin domain
MAGMQMSLNANPHSGGTTPVCKLGAMSDSVSNIHFHGLNVSPACGSDEVINTLIEPGQEFDYTIQIPANEPSGLYWYHPHPHGYSEGQVQGGATGAIVIEGIEQTVPSLAGMPEQIFVIRDQLTPLSQQNNSNVPAWDLSLDYVPVLFPSYTPAQVPVSPGQKQFWRVLNSAADTILNLQYIIGGAAQSVSVVAIDGVPITGGPIQQSSILLPPGARAEFVVTTPAVGQTAQLVTLNVDTGPDGDSDPARPIANIVAGTSAPTLPVVETVNSSAGATAKSRAQRFAALPRAAATSSAPQRTLYFSEVLSDPNNPNSPTNFYITQDGYTPQLFTMGQAPNIVVHSGTVETWVIQNQAMEDHIFHIHQIHFQVLAVNGVAVNDPAIRDTYDLPYWDGTSAYPSVTLAMDFRDPNIVGTFVYHCHILAHEDGGMMGAIQVLPPGAASTVAISSSAATVTPTTSTVLKATVSSSVSGGSTPTGFVQFQTNGGVYVGNPVYISGGVATLSASSSLLLPGANSVQAFYLGDSNYSESLSGTTAVSATPFVVTGAGATMIGNQANAGLQVVAANTFTNPVTLSCTLPSTLTGATCAVYPATVTGGGPATLAVVTTTARLTGGEKPGSAVLPLSALAFSALLLPLLRRRRRLKPLIHGVALFMLAGLLALSGCMGSTGPVAASKGPASGTYNVTVTGAGTYGTASFTSTITVPITVQ